MNLFADSFTYAFRSSGKYMLIIGAIMNVIASICMFAPVFGFFAYIFLASYFCSTYFTIIQSSAIGDSEAPEFPDASNILEDLVLPFFKVLGLALLALSPCLIYTLFIGENELIANILLIVGCIYLPMSLLAVAVLGYLGAATPIIVIPSIFKAGWLYWLAVVMLAFIYYLEGFVSNALEGLFIVQPMIMGVVSMYVLMTSARILGLVYRDRKEELGWL